MSKAKGMNLSSGDLTKGSQATLKSHNDSLQQVSTTLPSTTFSKDRSSLDGISYDSRRLNGGSMQIGGGSYGSYLTDHLQRLRKDIESTTGGLEREQRRLYKIDKDLISAESEYGQKRQKYRLFASVADDLVQHKADDVRTAERRLEKAIADLNQGASDNEQLREQIDQLRKERKVLNNVFKKLERGISRSNKEMNELVSQTNEHRQGREEASQKSRALGKQLERERTGFRALTDSIKAGLEHEAEIGREQERGQKDRSQAANGGNKRRTYMIADEEEAFSETDMFRRIFRLSFLNTIQRRHIRQHQKNIEVFEQAFATIKSSTGISDIEEIVKIFIALEQRNFSLLTYVNQLNREIESITIRNKELRLQLEDHKKSELLSGERRDSALNDINAQIAQTRAATKEKNVMIVDSSEVLQEVRPLLNNIVAFFKRQMPGLIRAGYEDAAPPLTSAPPSEDDENLSVHLTYIEDMFMLFRAALPTSTKEPKKLEVSQSKGQGVERPRDLPVAHIQGDDTDDEVEGGLSERMYSRSELRERATQAIQKRRKKPVQQGRHAEGQRNETDDMMSEAMAPLGTRRDPGGPPPASSVSGVSAASKESGDPGQKGHPTMLSKSPSMQETDEDGEGGLRWWRANGGSKGGHTKR